MAFSKIVAFLLLSCGLVSQFVAGYEADYRDWATTVSLQCDNEHVKQMANEAVDGSYSNADLANSGDINKYE